MSCFFVIKNNAKTRGKTQRKKYIRVHFTIIENKVCKKKNRLKFKHGDRTQRNGIIKNVIIDIIYRVICGGWRKRGGSSVMFLFIKHVGHGIPRG